MINEIKGSAHLFGKNIDTDQIYPGRYLEITDPKEIASHCLEGARLTFASSVKTNDFVIAGTNFGCGSSREHAAIALKQSGVGAVIAESFARIFYRNAINMGLPVLMCKDISLKVSQNDQLEIDLESGEIKNITKGETYKSEPLPGFIMDILAAGGIKPMYLTQNSQILNTEDSN